MTQLDASRIKSMLQSIIEELDKAESRQEETRKEETKGEEHVDICPNCRHEVEKKAENLWECPSCKTNYVGYKSWAEYFDIALSKHKHGDREYADFIECPECREKFIESLRKKGYVVLSDRNSMKIYFS